MGHFILDVYIVFGGAGGLVFLVLLAYCLFHPGALRDMIDSVNSGPLKRRKRK